VLTFQASQRDLAPRPRHRDSERKPTDTDCSMGRAECTDKQGSRCRAIVVGVIRETNGKICRKVGGWTCEPSVCTPRECVCPLPSFRRRSSFCAPATWSDNARCKLRAVSKCAEFVCHVTLSSSKTAWRHCVTCVQCVQQQRSSSTPSNNPRDWVPYLDSKHCLRKGLSPLVDFLHRHLVRFVLLLVLLKDAIYLTLRLGQIILSVPIRSCHLLKRRYGMLVLQMLHIHGNVRLLKARSSSLTSTLNMRVALSSSLSIAHDEERAISATSPRFRCMIRETAPCTCPATYLGSLQSMRMLVIYDVAASYHHPRGWSSSVVLVCRCYKIVAWTETSLDSGSCPSGPSRRTIDGEFDAQPTKL
jgi:hypothetical protein